ncbi:Ig-like domain-containing protein [Paenibacillus silvisoli]|uniref:Ig-like domain-containing protein n=1 Tax=Paenibacillus silvisoli TaxID=3110539 RepID=UPI0028064D4B|nr:tandem-95 repeat protein [Paenibacillus silvisoli]
MNTKWSKAISTIIALSTVSGPSLAFADTGEARFTDGEQIAIEHKLAIAEAARQGLLVGDQNGQFRPLDGLTRQELAVLLAKALKLDVQEVPRNVSSASESGGTGAGAWALPYIEAVKKAGLMLGESDGQFRPKDIVSREELAAIFVRAVNGQGTRGGQHVAVEDLKQSSPWASEWVSDAVRLGLIDTESDGAFKPKDNVQRQEIASFLISIFQTGQQQATITKVDGDVVLIDDVPYLITPALRQLIGDSNAEVLVGAKLTFNTKNRSLNDLSELEIVKSGSEGAPVKLNLAGTSFAGVLRVSGQHVTIAGDDKTRIGQLELNPSAGHIQLSAGMSIDSLKLPEHASVSDIITNYSEIKGGIGQVSGGSAPAPVVGVPTRTNHQPVVNGAWTSPAAAAFTVGENVVLDLSGLFTDEDADVLGYTVEALDADLAAVASGGATSAPTIRPVAPGTARFIVTVSDGRGGTAEKTVSVTVAAANQVPVVNTAWTAPASFTVGESRQLDLSGLFTDADAGDVLSYTVEALDAGVAAVASGGATSVPTVRPVAPGTARFKVTVSDGRGGTAEKAVSVTVAAANQVPVVNTAWTAPASFTVGESRQLDLSGLFTDADAGDVLSYTVEALDAGVAAVASGGATSVPTVRPVAPGTAQLKVTVNDGNGGTAEKTITVMVVAANQVPVVDTSWTPPTAFTVGENQQLDLSGLFTDADADVLSYTVEALNADKAAIANGGTTSTPTIQPIAPGTAQFKVTVNDGNGGTAEKTIAVTVVVANQVPVVDTSWTPPTAFTVGENQQLDLSVLFTDADADVLSYTVEALNADKATIANGGTTSTPTIQPIAPGTAQFKVTVNDGHGGMAEKTITVTVVAANQVPVVDSAWTAPVSFTVGENQQLDLSGLFTDADSDELNFTVEALDTDKAAIANGGTTSKPTIQPIAPGTAQFKVTVIDGHGGTAEKTITVTVVAANQVPVVDTSWTPPTAFTVGENQQLDLSGLFTDADADVLSYTVEALNADKATIVNGGATSTPTIQPIAPGTAQFKVTVNDGHGGMAEKTITVTVVAANQVPVVDSAWTAPVSFTVGENQQLDLSGLFTDADSDELNFTVEALDTDKAAIANGGTTSTPTIQPIAPGTAQFKVTVIDGHGGTAEKTITVTVVAANQVPVVDTSWTPPTAFTVGENQQLDLSGLFTDADADVLSYTVEALNADKATIVNGDATSKPTIQPIAPGTAQFKVTVIDGHGGTAEKTITVTVVAANQVPMVNSAWTAPVSFTVGENQQLDLSGLFTDADSDELNFTVEALDTDKAAIANGGTTSTPTIQPIAPGTAQFKVTVIDGQGGTAEKTITVTVIAANQVPEVNTSWTVPAAFTVGENQQLDLSGLFTDADADVLSYTIEALNASVAVVATGDATSVPTIQPVAPGTAQFKVTVNDGNGGAAEKTITVTVIAANQVPEVNTSWTVPAAFTVGENQQLDLSGLFTDADADVLSYTIEALNASVAVVATGDATSVPTIQPVAPGTAQFKVTVNDGNGGAADKTITVTVIAANQVPEVNTSWTVPAAFTVGENQQLDLSGLFTDADADVLSYTVEALNADKATIANGGATNTPTIQPIAPGTAQFKVTVNDGNGGTADKTITVTVVAANQVPEVDTSWTPPTAFTVGENQQLDLSGLFTDADADVLNYTVEALNADKATIANGGTTNTLTIQPIAPGTAQFKVTVNDGHGGTADKTITVTVVAANQVPEVDTSWTPPTAFTVGENQQLDLSGLFTDADADVLNYTVEALNADKATIANGGATNTPTIQPIAPGTAQFKVTVNDGNGGTAEKTITVTVIAANQVPEVNTSWMVPAAFTVGENQQLDLSGLFTDADADTLSFTVEALNASVAVVANGGATSMPTIQPVAPGTAQFKVTVNDGNGGAAEQTIMVTVVAANQVPEVNTSWTAPASFTVGNNRQVDLSGLFTDADADTLSFTVEALSASVATIASGGSTSTPTIQPVATGNAQFKVTVNDGRGGTAEKTITVTVVAANQVPVVNPSWQSPAAFTVGVTAQLDLTALFTDADTDILSYEVVALNEDKATIASDGSTSTPMIQPVAAGNAQFKVTVNDGHGGTAEETITVTVAAATVANQAPVVDSSWQPTTFTVGENGQLDLTGLFTDADHDVLTYTVVALDYTVAAIASGGTTAAPTIQPVSVGTARFSVTVSDGRAGGTVTHTITVTVQAPAVVKSVFISEMAWGSYPNNLAIELYNPTDVDFFDVHLKIGNQDIYLDGGWALSSGGILVVSDWLSDFALPDYYQAVIDEDVTYSTEPLPVSLYIDGELVDTATLYPEMTLRRVSGTIRGSIIPDDYQWDEYATDNFDGLGNLYNN